MQHFITHGCTVLTLVFCSQGCSTTHEDTPPEMPIDASAMESTLDSATDANIVPDLALAPDAGPPPALDGATPVTLENLPLLSIQPTLALGADGRLAVAGCGGDADDLGIWFALLDADNTPLQSPYALDTTTMGIQNEPSVCALVNGGYVVVWSMDAQETNADGQNLYVRGRRVDADGTPTDAADFEVHSGQPGNHWLGEVACDPQGGFMVVGSRSEDNQTFGVFAQRFDEQGALRGAAITLNSETMGTQAFPAADIAENGDAVIVWQDNPFDGQPDAINRIVARRLPADADAPPEREIIITRPTYDATRPHVAVDSQSEGFLVGATLDNRHIGVYVVDSDDAVTEVTVPRDGTRHSPIARAAGHDRYLVLHSNGVNMGASPSLFLVDAGQLTDGPVELTAGNLPPYSVALAYRAGSSAIGWTVRQDNGDMAVRIARTP